MKKEEMELGDEINDMNGITLSKEEKDLKYQ